MSILVMFRMLECSKSLFDYKVQKTGFISYKKKIRDFLIIIFNDPSNDFFFVLKIVKMSC